MRRVGRSGHEHREQPPRLGPPTPQPASLPASSCEPPMVGVSARVRRAVSPARPSPFRWYGPELSCHMKAGGGARGDLVGNDVSWPDITERDGSAMILADRSHGSYENLLRAGAGCGYQGISRDIHRSDQSGASF